MAEFSQRVTTQCCSFMFVSRNASSAAGAALSIKWILLIAFSVPMVFAVFTNHVWEDYYITFRASKNLAEGNGLVFQIGERLHTFTSPLGVLLPASLFWVTKSDTLTLWLFRAVSCAAFAGSAGLLWRWLREQKAGGVAQVISLALLLGSASTVEFTIDGMETAFLLFFCVLTLRELTRPEGLDGLRLGGALAGMMWTRPDAFVPGAAVFAGCMLFVWPGARWRDRRTWRGLLTAAGVGVALYGPWVAWTWWYYGTPIPHTITAKAFLAPEFSLAGLLSSTPLKLLSGQSMMTWVFMPPYFDFGGWPTGFTMISRLLVLLTCFLWVFRKVNAVGRAASFAAFTGAFYLQAIPVAPWYTPVWLLLAVIALGCGAEALLTSMREGGWGRRLLGTAFVFLVASQVAMLVMTAIQLRYQQILIEDNGRRKIGEWLSAHGRPGDTVMLECLGYIGYFSQLRMLDYPGLSSAEVVRARAEHGVIFMSMPLHFKPTWIVLRPGEYWPMLNAGKLNDYDAIKTWDANPAIASIRFLPGRNFLRHDAAFILLRRRQESVLPAPVTP